MLSLDYRVAKQQLLRERDGKKAEQTRQIIKDTLELSKNRRRIPSWPTDARALSDNGYQRRAPVW
jgi:hypothetical protein